jgi:hypothetical protein
MTFARACLANGLAAMGLAVSSKSHLSKIEQRAEMSQREVLRLRRQIHLLATLPSVDIARLAAAAILAESQNGQDLFVLAQTGFKMGGYFVDFGATDGVGINNSFILEREYGWTGIVAEPARLWHAPLRENRRCHIEEDCVWSRSGDAILFNEVEDGELSTIDHFSGSDEHAIKRETGHSYPVKTISLIDLLTKYAAPAIIDYLSIDTRVVILTS